MAINNLHIIKIKRFYPKYNPMLIISTRGNHYHINKRYEKKLEVAFENKLPIIIAIHEKSMEIYPIYCNPIYSIETLNSNKLTEEPINVYGLEQMHKEWVKLQKYHANKKHIITQIS